MALKNFNDYPMTLFSNRELRNGKVSWLQNPQDPGGYDGNQWFCQPDRRIHLDWNKKLYEPLGYAFLELMERDLGGHADRHAPMPFRWFIQDRCARRGHGATIFHGQVFANAVKAPDDLDDGSDEMPIDDTPRIGIQFQMPGSQAMAFVIEEEYEIISPAKTAKAFKWEVLNDEEFERLMFRLFSELPEFDNVQWLQKTHAVDSGRDISAIRQSTGARVLIQARHQKASINATAANAVVVKAETWRPPFQEVIIVTTSAFTEQAVRWIDNHNADPGKRPIVTPEPSGHLEVMLSKYPQLTSHMGLR